MKKLLLNSLIIFMASLVFISCEKDEDPEIPNEEELITTLIYTLSPNGGGNDVVLTFKDIDGDGGNAPVITADTLNMNETYTGSLELLNESEAPPESITEEIEEEDEEHQFFFDSSLMDVTVSYDDQDADGNPIGLSSTLTTQAAGSGTLTITLRHEPDKNASGVANGDITNAGGETDIEVIFPLNVQ